MATPDPHPRPAPEQFLGQPTPEKAAAADQRHQPAFQITHAAHEPSPVFSVPLALPLRRATAQTLPKRPVEK
jgi:hypothetical protein